jgi:hypothetical protein
LPSLVSLKRRDGDTPQGKQKSERDESPWFHVLSIGSTNQSHSSPDNLLVHKVLGRPPLT